jgi:hypothetical protein
MGGLLFQPDKGRLMDLRRIRASFKAVAATTGGRFSLMERVISPGGRTSPPQVHVDCVEALSVVSGELVYLNTHNWVVRQIAAGLDVTPDSIEEPCERLPAPERFEVASGTLTAFDLPLIASRGLVK